MIRYQKNPRKTKSVITVDGQEYQAKYIGKGMYSKVFRVGDRVIYYTRGDCGKEVLAMYLYNRMAHLPDLTRHEDITTVRARWYVFSSPYYRDVKRSDTSAWELRRHVIASYQYYTGYMRSKGIDKENNVEFMQGFVEYMKNSKYVKYSVVKALQEIVDAASNCGAGVGFDLHNKNFGVNDYGTLIFRDPIYVRD